MTEIGEHLCVQCGMCCTGHLFPVLQVFPAERAHVEAIGFAVRETAHGIRADLPCSHWDCKCQIYGQRRPEVCGGFSCTLLKRVESGQLDYPTAKKIVEEVKALADEIRAAVTPDCDVRHIDLRRLDEWCEKQYADPESMKRNGAMLIKTVAYWRSIRELFYNGPKKSTSAKMSAESGETKNA